MGFTLWVDVDVTVNGVCVCVCVEVSQGKPLLAGSPGGDTELQSSRHPARRQRANSFPRSPALSPLPTASLKHFSLLERFNVSALYLNQSFILSLCHPFSILTHALPKITCTDVVQN